jgi:hypothetical protein
MRTLKPRTTARPTATEALRIATVQAPLLPPTRAALADRSTTLNLRLRMSTVEAITAEARQRGLTQKQLVCQALAAAGVAITPSDLEDRTPRRRG